MIYSHVSHFDKNEFKKLTCLGDPDIKWNQMRV